MAPKGSLWAGDAITGAADGSTGSGDAATGAGDDVTATKVACDGNNGDQRWFHMNYRGWRCSTGSGDAVIGASDDVTGTMGGLRW